MHIFCILWIFLNAWNVLKIFIPLYDNGLTIFRLIATISELHIEFRRQETVAQDIISTNSSQSVS